MSSARKIASRRKGQAQRALADANRAAGVPTGRKISEKSRREAERQGRRAWAYPPAAIARTQTELERATSSVFPLLGPPTAQAAVSLNDLRDLIDEIHARRHGRATAIHLPASTVAALASSLVRAEPSRPMQLLGLPIYTDPSLRSGEYRLDWF